jgi:transposase-like protein
MDPHNVFCPNPHCPARGRFGQGNIRIHSRRDRRYRCQVCRRTFSESHGTVFYRLRNTAELVTLVVTLLAHGCPVQAIVAAFALDERTVVKWQGRAGQHCEQVHEHLVAQPRDLGQVQADELRVKKQGEIVWLAMALQVSTRLWLGGTMGLQRNFDLIRALLQKVRACALCRPLLFCSDGFSAYVRALRHVFREPVPTGQRGRPALRPWDQVYLAQVVKQYARRQVVGIMRRVVQGTIAQVEAVLQQTQGGGLINTAYIERLNATFRSRLAGLVRRGRALARQTPSLYSGMYLIGTVYNFCTFHKSLRLPGIVGGHKWLPRTPAMAAGLTDHCWTVGELLAYRLPLPRWTPPKHRGRPSAATKHLIAQWCT